MQGLVDSRGGKQSERLRRSEVSTEDKTADTRCFLCASAQGANPPPPTTQKALTFVSAFCVGCRGERCTEPQFGLPPTSGVAGLGHILVAAGIILFFCMLLLTIKANEKSGKKDGGEEVAE